MDAGLSIAIERLSRALDLYHAFLAAEAAADNMAGPVTRSRKKHARTRVLSERQLELDDVSRTMRQLIGEAIDALRSARTALVTAIEGQAGRALRCQKCGSLCSDLRVTRGCQHRLCRRCLLDSCEALFVRRVQGSSGILPYELQQPPTVITSAYVQDVRSHGIHAAMHCPFCSASIRRIPLRIPLYSDVLGVVDRLVYIAPAPNDGQRADISCYF